MRREILVILALFCISIPAVKSLFIPGGFTSHDLTHHVVRQISMDKLLSEGQFPPRWSGDLAAGFGYPVFLFNYPLPALVGEVFHKAGFNFVDSVKAVLFLSLIGSTFGMYLFLKSFLKSYSAAFLGAVFYLYAPIHLIVVYVSGAPGASLGLLFPPFIFLSIVKLWQKNSKFLLVGALSFAGLILSHNITAFIFMPIILAFVVLLKLISAKEKNHFLKNTVCMFLLGLGLSAFFWLPAISEKQFIRYDQLMKGIYQDQFPSLQQIIYSPWGYGLSHPQRPEIGDMSYQLGLAHFAVMMLLVLHLWLLRRIKTFLFTGVLTMLSFIFGIFFMLKISLPLWDNLPFLSYIQFPVRLLVVPVFSASLAAGLLIKYSRFRKILFVGLLILVLYANRNHLNINQSFDPGEQYYLNLSHKTSTTSFDENLPIWVKKIKTDTNHGKFSFTQGFGKINIKEDKSARVLAEIESTESATIRFNQYYFPGWEINIDGKKVNFDPDLIGADSEDYGLSLFDIEAGKHIIKAEFKNTPVRNIADLASLISLGVSLLLFSKYFMVRFR